MYVAKTRDRPAEQSPAFTPEQQFSQLQNETTRDNATLTMIKGRDAANRDSRRTLVSDKVEKLYT